MSLGAQAERERAKLTEQVTVRLDEELFQRLDAYVRQRERETRVPLRRSIVVREILEEVLPALLEADGGRMSTLRKCPECGGPGVETTCMGRDLVTSADPNIVTCKAGHRYPADSTHPRWQTDEIDGARPSGIAIPRPR